jgi:hypothetical protein
MFYINWPIMEVTKLYDNSCEYSYFYSTFTVKDWEPREHFSDWVTVMTP